MPILLHVLRWFLSEQVNQRTQTSDQAKGGDEQNPNIKKTWRQIPSDLTDRTPSLRIRTQELRRVVFEGSRKVRVMGRSCGQYRLQRGLLRRRVLHLAKLRR